MSNLYTRTIETERLEKSYKRTQQGMRKYRKAAIIFEMSRERKLDDLQKQLENHTYKPGKYNKIIVHEPKERIVHAPLLRDKIVQFSAHESLQEVYNPVFITDTYACFVGKGTHDAVQKIQHNMRQCVWQHTITITATDSNAESTTETYTFTKTNSAPNAPTITRPVQNLRVEKNGYIYYTPAADPDGDTQKIKIEVSENADFSTKQTFTTMEKENAGEWQTVENITNADAGANMRTRYKTTATGKIYIRAIATDSGSGTSATSATITASVGTVLQIETLPYNYDTMPEKIAVALKETRGEAAQTIEVCNNANDDAPTWETYTPTNGLHAFTNKEKTADKWAVATKVTIEAGEETGAIEINAICQGVC